MLCWLQQRTRVNFAVCSTSLKKLWSIKRFETDLYRQTGVMCKNDSFRAFHNCQFFSWHAVCKPQGDFYLFGLRNDLVSSALLVFQYILTMERLLEETWGTGRCQKTALGEFGSLNSVRKSNLVLSVIPIWTLQVLFAPQLLYGKFYLRFLTDFY